jgi:dihydrofolate reductase
MSQIILIVAAAANGVIGRAGTIPWRLSDDLRRFKALTLGHTVVMGRKTWDSLPKKPLPGRRNIVVTRNPDWQGDGAERACSVEEALVAGGDTVFVIGGEKIYADALVHATHIELTEVHRDFDGDARFDFDRSGWRETAREDRMDETSLRYSFVTLSREA